MAPDSFWEVLTERLGDWPAAGRSAATRGCQSTAVRQTCDPGLRVLLLGGRTAWPAQDVGRVDSLAVDNFTGTQPARAAGDARRRRPRGVLTVEQRAALEVLRGAGACGLAEDVTTAELRSAYRSLALRWHPDRHAGTSLTERAHLARTFATISDAYRRLAGGLRQAA